MVIITAVILLEIAGCWLLFKYLKRQERRGVIDWRSRELLEAAYAYWSMTLLEQVKELPQAQGATIRWSRYSELIE